MHPLVCRIRPCQGLRHSHGHGLAVQDSQPLHDPLVCNADNAHSSNVVHQMAAHELRVDLVTVHTSSAGPQISQQAARNQGRSSP